MRITIDGKSCECEAGEFLRDVAARNGIEIPTLCHHEGLSAQGCCRVCLVEVEEGSRSKIVVSCVYPVERELTAYTDSEAARENRALVLGLLKARAPDSPEVSALHKRYGGVDFGRFQKGKDEKCVLCGLCARACEELGAGAITTAGRGVDKAVKTPFDEALDCIGCASCAQICPTKAIAVRETADTREIWGRTFALAYCEACGKVMGTAEEIAHAQARGEVEPSALCADCRRKKISETLADTFGIA